MASKLKEAKASAQEVDLDGNHIAAFDESNENATETEDETDQAKASYYQNFCHFQNHCCDVVNSVVY